MVRTLAWVAAALAAIVLVAAGWLLLRPSTPRVQSFGEPAIGGPFQLVDEHGAPFTDHNLKGRPSLVFFGFTHCPEVCPTTLAHMSAWLKALGPDADKLNVVFVSVDPDRDTAPKMASYLSAFDPRIHGLTGTPAQTDKIASEYHVYHRKVPLKGGDYTVDHSAAIYELDKDGKFAGVLTYEEPDKEALASIHKLIG